MSTIPPKPVHVVIPAPLGEADEKDVGGFYPPIPKPSPKKRERAYATVGIPESPKKKRVQRGKLVQREKLIRACAEFKRHEKFKWSTSAGRHAFFKASANDILSICGPYSGYYGNRSFVFYKPAKQDDGSWKMLTEFYNRASDDFTHQVIYLIDVPAKTEEIFNEMK